MSGAHVDDPIVVVGSGIAGMSLALRAGRRRQVVLLTKGPLISGSTALAQGGIAAAIGPADGPEQHARDTIAAGAGLCDPDVVRWACERAPARVRDLVRAGVAFDCDADGALHLAREAAHSHARVAHAGGDATGARIAAALAARVLESPRIEVREGWRALEALSEAGVVRGVRARDPEGRTRDVRGAAVVLATGGLGAAFTRTTNPEGATGDGMALAWRAGAMLVDLELIQFHPTALAADDGAAGRLPLISEALRGAGAVLRDDRGRRFMADRHERAELAPRDVVARAIAEAAAEGRVTLELPGVAPDEAAARFPTAAAACARHGLLLGRDPVPVAPAAHFAMGGVLADVAGRTGVPGLYAIGECASTGMHGANRLASNAMLEGAVMAAECARALEAPVRAAPLADRPAPDGVPEHAGGEGTGTARIRQVMSQAMGVVRDGDRLARASRELAALDPGTLDADGRSLADVSRLAVAAARLREERRGAHFRRDHERTDPGWERRLAWLGDEPRLVAVRQQVPERSAA